MATTPRIALFVGRLGAGGAERQFSLLATELTKRGRAVHMFTLFPGGAIWDELEREGSVALSALFPSRPGNRVLRLAQLLTAPWKLRKSLLRFEATVLYSALHAANLAARLAVGGGAAHVRLVWGMRASAMQLNLARRIPFRLCALLSRSVDLSIANSSAGLTWQRDAGYRTRQEMIIANGIDTSRFQPDAQTGQALRTRWMAGTKGRLIGIVARIDPMKDHANFLEACARLAVDDETLRFVIVGSGPATHVAELEALTRQLDLDKRVTFAGERADVEAVYNALDICCSSSAYGEGFSNVIGEAMACGTPCVATDVGDAAMVIGDSELIVPPRNSAELARALASLCASDVPARGRSARARIVENFSVAAFATRTEAALLASGEGE